MSAIDTCRCTNSRRARTTRNNNKGKKMNEELKREVSLQINYLGDSEYALGYNRAETKDVATIVEVINKHRAQFDGGKVYSIGSASYATVENWKSLACASDQAARNELLRHSSELSELDELERKANEARRVADEKNRALQAAWNEFSALPEKADNRQAWPRTHL
jgi:hypothetical protein